MINIVGDINNSSLPIGSVRFLFTFTHTFSFQLGVWLLVQLMICRVAGNDITSQQLNLLRFTTKTCSSESTAEN